MTAATAEGSLLTISITQPTGNSGARAFAIERTSHTQTLSDNRLGLITGPSRIPAEWFGTVERRIRDSVVVQDIADTVNDGRFISPAIANSAVRFFRETSDVLPGEPYLYSSPAGDLVAEFKLPQGTLTAVIGPNSIAAFGTISGLIYQDHFDNIDQAARERVQGLTNKLRSSTHGVDATK